MFESILSQTAGTLSITSALICMGTSIILGVLIACVHMYTTRYNKNFVITLSILPVMVQVIIMMVNGNLGTSVAVLGAFSLVRFRSMPGNSREIVSIFFAMGIGLAVGMGHILFASVITVLVSIVLVVLSKTKFGERDTHEKKLKIVIPEDLDYSNVFDDLFEKYTKTNELEKVKTTNMGSLFELTYRIVTKKDANEKEFLDEIRCRNGNLNITLARETTGENEL